MKTAWLRRGVNGVSIGSTLSLYALESALLAPIGLVTWHMLGRSAFLWTCSILAFLIVVVEYALIVAEDRSGQSTGLISERWNGSEMLHVQAVNFTLGTPEPKGTRPPRTSQSDPPIVLYVRPAPSDIHRDLLWQER